MSRPADEPRIVLIDQDLAVRSALRFSLELDGYAVETYDSAEALAVRALSSEPGCLVLEHQLSGMNGLDLVDLLRSRQVDVPAVLITTHPTGAVRRRAADLGVPIVEKPLLDEALVGSVRAVLAGRP